MSISKFLYSSSVTVTMGLFLVGCGASIPDATDEEIIALLGDSFSFSPQDKSPLVVRQYVVECAETLSDSNTDVTKDMSVTSLGQVKTECRKALGEKLDDKTRNAKDFKLEHFENKDFAKRLAQVAQSSKAAYDLHESKRIEEIEKRREEERAVRQAEAEQKLAAAQAAFEQSLAGYEDLVDEVLALCDEANQTMITLKEQGKNASLSVASGNCQQSRQDLLKAADDNRAKWAEVGVRESMDTGFREPDINSQGAGTVQGLAQMIVSLKTDLADMKNRLER